MLSLAFTACCWVCVVFAGVASFAITCVLNAKHNAPNESAVRDFNVFIIRFLIKKWQNFTLTSQVNK